MRIAIFVLIMDVILVFSCFTGFFLVENCNATGNIIYVDDDNTAGPWDGTIEHPYQYIQDGVDAANDEDTVYVYSGTYSEDISIEKQITLQGENKESTVVNGEISIFAGISASPVTIKGFTIQNDPVPVTIGINVPTGTDYHTITENIITNNWIGISLHSSSDNNIFQNTFINNQEGIRLTQSSNNIISGNTVTDSYRGIIISDSSDNNLVSGNTFENNEADGIEISSSYFNDIRENFITNSNNGILSYPSHDSYIFDNTIIDCDYGIFLIDSPYNDIQGNTIKDCTNDGIKLQSSANNNIEGNNAVDNSNIGIGLYYSSNNNLRSSIISNNTKGIYFYDGSSNNVIEENTIENNNKGIYFEQYYGSSDNNLIYHNYFIDNVQNAEDKYNNQWDNGYPSGGNYWDDYTGVDSNGDGIGDTPYDIPGGSNQDLYPLGYFDEQQPPNKPYCLSPTDGSTNIELIPTLKVNVFDPDGDTMDVYFYNASNDELITYELGVDSGGTASIPWYGCQLSYDSTYYWYAIANDSVLETISDTWSFTTKSNQPPTQSDESPSDGETDISSKYVKLWITVDDDSCDSLKLYWRTNASGSWETIDTYSMGSAGGPASYVKSYVFPDYGKTYYWSVNLTDGTYWANKTYHFTIKSLPPESNSPTADTGGPYYGTVDSTVYFTGTGSTDSDGTIIMYTWDFGDGKEGYGISPTHIYSTAGNYTVILTVTDNNGLTDSDMTTAHISEVEGEQTQTDEEHHPPDEDKHIPVADANGPYSGYVNLTITFDGSKSYDIDGFITSYEWDFDDGHTGIGISPTHYYPNAGNYIVTLVVTDNQGLTDSDMATVIILDDEPSDITGFEIIFALTSIAIVLFWKRKRY